jgi:hypothetical protein
MTVNDWVNVLAAFVGMIGVLTPYMTSYARGSSFIGLTKRIKELITAKKEISLILSSKNDEEKYPSSEYLKSIIDGINNELKKIENKKQIGFFITFCTIEVGLFFLITFSRLSNILAIRILGPVGKGGYGFWEGVLEPIWFRMILILFLSIVSVSATIMLKKFVSKKISKKYYVLNFSLIIIFNIIAVLVFSSSWWILVWIDRLTSWI